ncbi:MAG: hypothetical protein IJ657_00100 [Acidaminococcaceae bacterium]|nr:hypothetical protein [Acidaminococcaceae bacterium]
MNAEVVKFDAQKKKLQGLCDEHGFVFVFDKEHYPIVLTIGVAQKQFEQGKLIDDGTPDEPICDPNAKVVWVFRDGNLSMTVKGGTFTIGKELRSKIENILLKMINFWQQYFFRSVIENKSLKKNGFPAMPKVDEEIKNQGEPIEEAETDGD